MEKKCSVEEERKEIFDTIMEKLNENEMVLLEKESYTIFKIKDEIEKVRKYSGLKRKKMIDRAAKRLKKEVVSIYEKLQPTNEDIIFHCLLDANMIINRIFDIRTKLVDKMAYLKDVDIETAEKSFEFKKFKQNEELAKGYLNKKANEIDTRMTNTLAKILIKNSFVINRRNLKTVIEELRKTVKITIENKVLDPDLKELIFNISVIVVNIRVAKETMEILKTSYNKEELKSIKYMITRINNFVNEMEREIFILDIKKTYPKYFDLIIESFKIEGCPANRDNVDSYVEYLKWLDKRKLLKQEFKLLEELKNKKTA
jgi:hypothetical protein